MKRILMITVVLLGLGAQAQAITLFCTKSSQVDCEARVANAFGEMGCEVQALSCETYEDDERKEVCQVQASRCQEPTADLMITTQCRQGEKVSLRPYDRGLTLTWWMGMFGSYLRDVCKF